MKNSFQGVIIVIILIFVSINCNLYEIERRQLISYNRTDKSIVLIDYVNGGATTAEVIQIRMKKMNQKDSVLKSFEKNYLESSKLLNDTTLYLLLKDTGSIKLDTEIIKIPYSFQ